MQSPLQKWIARLTLIRQHIGPSTRRAKGCISTMRFHFVVLPEMRLGGRQDIQFQCSRHTLAISRIRSSTVRNMPLQDLLRSSLDRASRVVEEQLLLLRGHLAEEIARLRPVIIL
jgi:hypothetical protein